MIDTFSKITLSPPSNIAELLTLTNHSSHRIFHSQDHTSIANNSIDQFEHFLMIHRSSFVFCVYTRHLRRSN